MSDELTHVLVVDDSAVVRQTLLSLLSELGGFRVAVAADPFIAMRRMAVQRPDVIVLDLQMPRMDGLTFLRKIMAEDPIPVVVCSAFAAHTGCVAIDALEAGAVDVITKPTIDVRGFLEDQLVSIVDTLRGAARARVTARHADPDSAAANANADCQAECLPMMRPAVVAIGASTGGTQALRSVLRAMPADAPAFLIVQHMPAGFTRAFSERLDQESLLHVKEAADGDRVQAGQALVAPGDRHLRLGEDARGYYVSVAKGPLVSRHRPSVDELFRSVAHHAGHRAVGVLLTGMGDDGAEGLLEMKRAGAATVAQDEATSVVFGMPKEAIRRGAAGEVLPLPAIPEAIRALSNGRSAAQKAP